jgi:hypothetical protein
LQWQPNCSEWLLCRVGLFDSLDLGHTQSVSRVLVTDSKGILESSNFRMQKMTFAFRVTLRYEGQDQENKMSWNDLTGSTLASTNPPNIGVLYNFFVTPG